MPALDAKNLAFKKVEWGHWLPPMLLLEFSAPDGHKVRLCDFGSAGEAGTPYRSWLDVENVNMDQPQFFTPTPDAQERGPSHGSILAALTRDGDGGDRRHRSTGSGFEL